MSCSRELSGSITYLRVVEKSKGVRVCNEALGTVRPRRTVHSRWWGEMGARRLL